MLAQCDQDGRLFEDCRRNLQQALTELLGAHQQLEALQNRELVIETPEQRHWLSDAWPWLLVSAVGGAAMTATIVYLVK